MWDDDEGVRSAVFGAAVAVAMAGCGGSRAVEWPSPTWATDVDLVAEAMTEAYDAEDAYQTARFYSAGGTLDLSIWGLGVLTTPGDVVDAVRSLWHQQPGFATVGVQHVFVTPDGAVIWWTAQSWEGFQNWAQTFVFSGGRTTSRAYTAIEAPFDRLEGPKQELFDFVERYLAAWAGDAPFESVYAEDVIVRDEIAGTVWSGLGEVAATRASGPPVQRGPWPTMFGYQAGDRREAIVVVQLGGECPAMEARRLIFDPAADVVGWEARYTHLPSARRCLDDLGDAGDGWWTTFELPVDLQENVTGVVDAGGTAVALVNAEANQRDYARWLVDRFVESGLGPPPLAAMWFPPSLDCDVVTGLAITHDVRYEGRHTIVLCTTTDRLEWADSESGWASWAVATGLHELAHHWMREVLDDTTRAAFVERAGLIAWRDVPEPADRGVEHAAYTIAWGLAGSRDARYPISPVPACEELEARFELLTGRSPLTTCGDGGWSP